MRAEAGAVKGAVRSDQLFKEVAEKSIEAYLMRVQKLYPLAAEASATDPEFVHQLRVNSRKAAVAIKLFAPCFPRRKRVRLSKALKSIRDGAGRVRDWDVFTNTLVTWQQSSGDTDATASDYLYGFCDGSRAVAVENLKSLYTLVTSKRLEKLWSSARDSFRIPGNLSGVSLTEFARTELLSRYQDFVDGLREESGSPQELHQSRIHAKRLRYALELLGSSLNEPHLETLRKDVEAAQDVLGTLHDSHIAILRLDNMITELQRVSPLIGERVRQELMRFRSYHEQIYQRKIDEYHRSRTHWLLTDFGTLFR